MAVDYSLRDAFNAVLASRIGTSGLFSVFDGFKRTDAEAAALVTPTVYVPSLHIDVERYGAVADDSTDNSAAFTRVTAVLNSKGGGTVLFPSDGIYRTSTTFSIPGAGCQYIGNGRWKTGIRWIGSAGSVFSMANTASANSYCRFQDFAILLANSTDIGIDATSLGLSIFDNLRIWGGSSFATRKGTGIKVSSASASAYGNEFTGLDIQYCTNGMQLSSAANEQHFFGGQINSCDAGLLMDGTGANLSDHVRLFGVRLENNAKAADVRDWKNLLFSGCRFEKNSDGTYGVYYAGGSTSEYPMMFVANGYHSYAAGNAIFSNAATGHIQQIGENANEYDETAGTGGRHLGLGTHYVGNPSSSAGGTIQSEGSAADADLTLLPKGAGKLVTQNILLASATPTGSGAQVSLGNTVSTTVGAAGGAAAPPATPLGYLSIDIGGSKRKIPYYNP